jgi:apolipoprotein N-acyltransferase
MKERFADGLSFCSSVAIGLAISTGHPVGLAAAFVMPVACLTGGSRRSVFRNASAYYSAGLWPMIPGLQRYLGHSADLLTAILIWSGSSILLSAPWTLAWTSDRHSQYWWRVLLASLAGIVPPLGLIGFNSPVIGAGYLFPGTGWFGLAATALLPGIVLALSHSRASSARIGLRVALTPGVAMGIYAHAFIAGQPPLPARWEAVNTNFGDLSRPFRDFSAAQWIQEHIAASQARVVIFPEFVVPFWTDATRDFWSQTLLSCRSRGLVLAIGAGLPRERVGPSNGRNDVDLVKSYDFLAAIQALQLNGKSSPPAVPSERRPSDPISTHPVAYDNTLLILGAESSTFYQRVPVPIGMWQPLSRNGVPLRLAAPGVVKIDGQRVAVLICYEQILTYPILASMLQHPTVLVGISNTFWFDGTPIPRYQASAVRAWARLFGVPYLLAVNS